MLSPIPQVFIGGSYTLPAMDNNGCVEGPLVAVMTVHFLDEAEQVPFAVGEAPAGRKEGFTDSRCFHGRITQNSGGCIQ